LKDIPSDVISLSPGALVDPHSGLLSSIFPLLSPKIISLHNHLHALGYGSFGLAFPIVPKGQSRIRVVIHSGNTEDEIRSFVATIRKWALSEMAQHDSRIEELRGKRKSEVYDTIVMAKL
jgi:hypothetical protein